MCLSVDVFLTPAADKFLFFISQIIIFKEQIPQNTFSPPQMLSEALFTASQFGDLGYQGKGRWF